MIYKLTLLCLWLAAIQLGAQTAPAPVRVAVIGLVHTHVAGFFPRALKNPDIQLVGIVETNQQLCAKYAERFHLSTNLFFNSLADLMAVTNVQAVATYTSTYDHKRVVEECAPLGLDVMMEKPLAVNMKHARAIAAAAKKGHIQIIVNYETSWYPANHAAYQMAVEQKTYGDLRKIVVHDGHPGPKEIGCPPEFLQWLTDPVLDGGGALMDFGCYGADLMTWLMHGQRPTSVFAVTQQIKPEIYPKVDDEATIVLTYPKAQGIIQASWNWPVNRKDMEIYAQTGQIMVPNDSLLRVRSTDASKETEITPEPLIGAQNNALSYLAAVVRGDLKPEGLSSLEVNMTVVEILDAAKKSAATGKRIYLK
ncbi:MAG TPA: Gfo/Idh/MocA family oxidoreductase [Candidatus Sulfotelmatobacter sp.]|nr:Gfo/Idh/MocA family oxidoreductase [Candidatus Sulfotelmatobacter sp.]